jgi:hypothetical protein
MAKAIRYARTGGPEVLEYVDVEVGEPGPGEARVRNHAIGLNFIDVYFRNGLYPAPLPAAWAMKGRAWSRRWARAWPMSSRATAWPMRRARTAPTASCA